MNRPDFSRHLRVTAVGGQDKDGLSASGRFVPVVKDRFGSLSTGSRAS